MPSGRIILALAVQTWRQSIRRKVLLVLALFFAIVAVGTEILPRHEPLQRVHILVSLCLWAMSFCGIIVAVFLAATAIPEDRASQTIVTVLTKPVGRLNYLLGRITGFALTLGAILLVMGVISVGFLRIVAAYTPGAELAGKRGFEAVDTRVRLGERIAEAPKGDKETNWVLLPRFAATGAELIFQFKPQLYSLPADNVTLELKPAVRAGVRLPQTKSVITIYRPGQRGAAKEYHVILNSEKLTRVHFPRDLIDPQQGVFVSLRRTEADTSLRFSPGDIMVMARSVPFEFSFFKALLVVFFGFLLIIVISITASTFLSRWVAVLTAFSAYFFAAAHQWLNDYMGALKGNVGFLGMNAASGIPAGHAAPDPFIVRAINGFFHGMLWVVTHIFPDFDTFSPGHWLTAMRDVPLGGVGLALSVLVAYGLSYLVLAQLVFWRKELLP